MAINYIGYDIEPRVIAAQGSADDISLQSKISLYPGAALRLGSHGSENPSTCMMST